MPISETESAYKPIIYGQQTPIGSGQKEPSITAAFRQKNELGFSMGIGCGMLILMNAIINISCSIGILPPTSSFLPFFSAGGSNTILCYFLTGLVISIYRYKDIYPCDLGNKMIAKKQSL